MPSADGVTLTGTSLPAASTAKNLGGAPTEFSETAVMTGIATQNYRLCADKSTQNVSIDSIHSNIAERQARREELLKELGESTGGEEVESEDVIDV